MTGYRDVERPQVAINRSCHLLVIIDRGSHDRSRNTTNRYISNITKKYKVNTPQPGSGQAPSHYIIITLIIIQKNFCSHYVSVIELNS